MTTNNSTIPMVIISTLTDAPDITKPIDITKTTDTIISGVCRDNCLVKKLPTDPLYKDLYNEPTYHPMVKLKVGPETRVILFSNSDLTGTNHVIDNNSLTDWYNIAVEPSVAKIDTTLKTLNPPFKEIKALIVTKTNNPIQKNDIPYIIEGYDNISLNNSGHEILFIVIVIIILFYFIKNI
jgi:hypothetical protein